MKYTFQYDTIEDRDKLITEHSDKTLIEEQNITDGNFLVFSDDPENDTKHVVFITIPEEEHNKVYINTDYLIDLDFRLLMLEMGLM